MKVTPIRAVLLALVILFRACTFDFAHAADVVSDSVGRAQVVVQSLADSGECSGCAQIAQTLGRVKVDAGALATAFRAGDNTTSVQKAAAVTRALDALISTDAKLIPASKRALVLAILAAADIAIAEIANHVQAEAPAISRSASSNADVAVMVEYAKKPRLRARSSQTGKFVSMDYAKKHPDVTTVERY